MKKGIARVTTLVLAVLIAVSCVYSALAASPTQDNKLVSVLGIMVGDENGNFDEDGYLTREQLAKITVAIADPEYIPVSSVSPYRDVPYQVWSSGYIKRVSELGIFIGFPDGTFRPNEYVNVEQASKIMLELLGYGNIGASADWAQSQVNAANRVGILEGVDFAIGQPITRINVAKMIENTLLSQMKDSPEYLISKLNCTYYDNAVIISDKTVSGGYVSTTVGNFKKTATITDDSIGKSGKAVVNKKNALVYFAPSGNNTKSYIVKSVAGDSITVFNQSSGITGIPDETLAYINGQQMTYSQMKSLLKIGDKLSIVEDEFGNIDYVFVSGNGISDPGFMSSFPITDNTVVIKDGTQSSKDALDSLDICYYISDIDTVLVYSNTVTDVYEKAYPNKDKPTSVTISGVNYIIESGEAVNKLSSIGSYNYGDTITLLLGRDDKIADVIVNEQFVPEKYTVYRRLDKFLVVYKGNQRMYLDVEDTTDIYEKEIKYTYQSFKSKLEMGDVLYVKRDSQGDIDYISYVKGNIVGPKTVENSEWLSELTNDASGVTITRDGVGVSAAEIKTNDIVYYLTEADMIHAYSTKKTGVYERAYPNKDVPVSITVSGVSYEIEGNHAFDKLSSTGNIQYGDPITLLLGKDNTVVDVSSMSENDTIAGYLIDCSMSQRETENGNTIYEYVAQVLTSDGVVNSYAAEKDYENYEGRVVKVSFKSGKAALSTVNTNNSVSGTFNWSKKTLGSYKLSDDLNIIDVMEVDWENYAGKGIKVFPQRIDKNSLSSSNILYANIENGEITDLILNDYTGDIYDYGIVLKAENVNSQALLMGNYQLNVNGNILQYVTQNKTYPVSTGNVISFAAEGTNPVMMKKINAYSGKVTSVDVMYAYIGNNKYLLSDDVVIYNQVSNTTSGTGLRYEIIEKEDIDYEKSVTAYYDKAENKGGRIRVIVIRY